MEFYIDNQLLWYFKDICENLLYFFKYNPFWHNFECFFKELFDNFYDIFLHFLQYFEHF